MDFFVWLPIIMRLIEVAPKISDALNKKQSVNDLITGLAPDLVPVIKQVGAQLFPQLDPMAQVEAGALAFDPARVRWIQASINTITNAGLQVDGHYGQKTKAAVTEFQHEHNLEADGWAGKNTSAVIEVELATRKL